jgi:hypothetical protein
MMLRYQVRDQQAALESDRVALVFHTLSGEQRRIFHFQGMEQAVQIAGPGISSIATTCTSGKETIAFRSDYTAGTNILEFGTQRVLLTDSGRRLLVGDQTVDLSEGRKIIHFKGDRRWVE